MPSLQGRIVDGLLPLSGIRFSLGGERRLRALLRLQRACGPSLPSRSMRSRLAVDETAIDGCRVFTVAPRGGATGPAILYLHGGGYAFDIAPPHWDFVGRLARRLDATVTVPLYPLLPERSRDEMHAFVTARWRDLAARAPEAGTVVMGDSAGGGLALAMPMQWRDAGLPLPGRLVLISPWLDVACPDPAQPALARLDRMLDLPGVLRMGRWYAGDLALTDPRVSPLYGDLAGLPPIQVFSGTHDLLHADAARLRARAAGQGVAVEVREYAGLGHVFPILPIPEAAHAFSEIVAFLAMPAHPACGKPA
jgi:acetyl esterase/lipase